jgi:predicted transcriptional regulator
MKLVEWLNHRRMTHEAFGILIGAERSAVTRYVNGRMPKSVILARIAAVTDGQVTANDFVDVQSVAVDEDEPQSERPAA